MQVLAVAKIRPLDNVEIVEEVGGYITLDAAARALGVKRPAVTWAITHNRLRAIQIGECTRLVDKRSLARYIRTRQKASAGA